MTDRNRLFDAQALEHSTVARVPLTALQMMIASDPASAKHLGSMTAYGQDAILFCVADLLIRDATVPIAAVLLRVTGIMDGIEPDDPRGYGLTQTLIGDLANASRPTVVRALAEYVRQRRAVSPPVSNASPGPARSQTASALRPNASLKPRRSTCPPGQKGSSRGPASTASSRRASWQNCTARSKPVGTGSRKWSVVTW
jgi:hypothetical protein